MPAETRSLHSKLAEVMGEAERIPKLGSYKKPGEYGHFMFVQVGDAADAIRKALAVRKVSMLPSAVEVMDQHENETKSGGTMTTVTVRTTWTLVDGESGETATIQSLGTGADTGDKYSPKAQTNAMKYALLMGFLLSTGDDPELSDTSDRQAAPAADPEPELMDTITRTGTVKPGNRDAGYGATWQETPEGHIFRFKLDVSEDKSIPQVVITAKLGEPIYALAGASLAAGAKVTVKGMLYAIRQSGRQVYYRLVVGDHPSDFIETSAGRFPSTEPVEAESVPAFTDADLAEVGVS